MIRYLRLGQRGYTLVELMTTVFILATLYLMFSYAWPYMQEKARDRRRQFELSTLQRQIELYKQENGAYPNQPDGAGSFFSFFLVDDAFAAGYAPKQITVPSLVPITTTPSATAGEAVMGEPDSYSHTARPDFRSRT